MTAVPSYPTPPSNAIAPCDALVAYADALQAAGRIAEAEAALRDAITISPDSVVPYRALSLLLMRACRDIEAFATCGTMLARAGRVDAETMRVAAEILLFLHIRHETLVTRQHEPARLDFRPVGVPDVAPMVLAHEYLPRARALAHSAAGVAPHDVTAQCVLAECELRANYASAARQAAEHAVSCEPTLGALIVRALAHYADHRERAALDALRQPQLTELVPELGTGQQLSVRYDGPRSSSTSGELEERRPWTIPYRVHHAGMSHARTVTVHTAPPTTHVVPGGRVVGDLFFAIDRNDQAFVHGVVEDPDVQFGVPRCHDLPTVLAHGRNCVLWPGSDRRLLLHSPAGERMRGGRAFLLASNASSNYYHWIADALGRLSAMPEVLTDPDVRFVVPSPLLAFQVETLGWLGITAERMVQVAPDEIVEFDELLVVAHRKDGGCTDPGVWQWLRSQLTIPEMSAAPAPTRRLYLHRSGRAGMRRLLNEEEAGAICVDHGFELVDTAALTVAQRRDLFSEAALVVGPTGAGLTDLLFAPTGARTILFGQRGYLVPSYSALAEALGHSVRYLLGTEEQSGSVYPNWDYRIDVRELRSALRTEVG
jgi:capsular polysaccharide biosynthesis protein